MNSDEQKQTGEKGHRVARIVILAILAVLALLVLFAVTTYRSLIVKPDLPQPEAVVTPPTLVVDPETGEENIIWTNSSNCIRW